MRDSLVGILIGLVWYAAVSALVWAVAQEEILSHGPRAVLAMAIVAVAVFGLVRVVLHSSALRLSVSITLLVVSILILLMPTPVDMFDGPSRVAANWLLYLQVGARYLIAPAVAVALIAVGRGVGQK